MGRGRRGKVRLEVGSQPDNELEHSVRLLRSGGGKRWLISSEMGFMRPFRGAREQPSAPSCKEEVESKHKSQSGLLNFGWNHARGKKRRGAGKEVGKNPLSEREEKKGAG